MVDPARAANVGRVHGSAMSLPVPGTNRPQRVAPEEPAWVSNPRLSQVFLDANDKPMRLYYIGALAEALGKRPVTVRSWITKGVLPDAGLRTAEVDGTVSTAGRRLWTREQIEVIVAIARSEKIIGGDRRRVQRLDDTNFRARVWNEWRARRW